MIKHKEVKGIFSFAEFSAALAKHVFLPLKILIFWFQIVAFRILIKNCITLTLVLNRVDTTPEID